MWVGIMGLLLAGCASTVQDMGSPTSTSTITSTTAAPANATDLGTVPTDGWIVHTIRSGGVIMSIKTPPSWSHELTPSMNGNTSFNNTTYVSDFALHPFCYHRKGVIGCAPGQAGRLPPDTGVLSATTYTANSATIPRPYPDSLGGTPTTIDGFPATAATPNDARCTSLGSALTYYYGIFLWVPAGAQLAFCINGPDIERLEATIATIAASSSFRPDPNSTAMPVSLFGQNVTTGGSASPSQIPYCTGNEATPSVAADVSQANGRTTIGVTTTFSQATPKKCGLSELSTCGFYGDFAIFGPSHRVLWTWQPVTLGRQCTPGVSLLPVNIEVPSWSVPTTLLSKGMYTVRMVNIENGVFKGPTLASTSFQVR
jgi:hypothetical protein